MQLTSNLLMNSAKMPKKASEVVIFESSPKKDNTLLNSSMALCCRSSRDRMAGWALSRKDWEKWLKEKQLHWGSGTDQNPFCLSNGWVSSQV